jgi:membrane protease YdiL (CAAX protease family)
MKRCDYCGRETGSEALYCQECGTPLPPEIAAETSEKASPPEKEVLPDYEADGTTPRWTAREAWKCAGMMAIFYVLVSFALAAVFYRFPEFRHWLHSGVGHFASYTFQFGLFVLTALYFSRVSSWEGFLKGFGLNCGPSSYIWFALVVTLLLRATSHFLITSGLSRGVTNTSVRGFILGTGFERYLFVAPLLMAPFCEEIFMRGFLYLAFRGSYSMVATTALIVAITGLLHIDQFLRSWAAVMSLSAITILQCFLRERTGSLWDCIICHFVFNFTGLLTSLLSHR